MSTSRFFFSILFLERILDDFVYNIIRNRIKLQFNTIKHV